MNENKNIVRLTRFYRKIHKWIGMFLFIFFFFISVTGLLLGWKKHSGGLILPKTEKGISTNMKDWLSYDSLHTIAINALHDSFPENLSPVLDRIDARPDKGIVKFVFKNHYTEIQLDCTTGKVLAVNIRTSDIIEQIHDGSILDVAFNTSDGQIKLGYTTLTGISLLLLTVTGFFLWYNPILIRNKKEKNQA
ncbi:MAG: PepSY domain-containing protein [Cyclobacteriaceae bacterium]|nr:PepSY domain-containing protein [Cyclobacteriaceae bacterium]